MKSILIATFSIFLILIAWKAGAADGQWQLEFEKEGIRVYSQIEGTSPYKQIKVSTTINAPMEKILEILTTFSGYKNWMSNVAESKLLNQSDSAYYVFLLEDAAWPMQNRYQVSRFYIRQSAANSKVGFRSVPNYIEKRTDAIQIKQFEGYWALEDKPDHQCTLEYVLIQNPGGHVPPWLANFHAIENPFHNVTNLKHLAENSLLKP